MSEETTARPPLSDRSGVNDAVRVQILATEHWGLLATRSMAWNEMFTRASMFLTVLSATVVALALVAQATEFGHTFRLFALLLLPVVLFLGWATYMRLTSAAVEDLWCVIGMNRLRHAYLELAPELEPYFTTGHHDDEAGVLRTLTFTEPSNRFDPVGMVAGVVASTPALVGIMSAVVAGVLAGLIVDVIGGGTGLVVAAEQCSGTGSLPARGPRFPGPGTDGLVR